MGMDPKVSKESSLLLIPASRCSGTVDSIEESQDSWIQYFLDVILILIYIKLECRCLNVDDICLLNLDFM